MGIAGQWMCIPASHQYYLLLAILCLCNAFQCSGTDKVISGLITPLHPSSILLCLCWKLSRVASVPGCLSVNFKVLWFGNHILRGFFSVPAWTRRSASVYGSIWTALLFHITSCFVFSHALGDFGEGVGDNCVGRQRISLRPQNWPRCLSSRVSH